MDIVPVADRPYHPVTKGQEGVVLATQQDGANLWWPVVINTTQQQWGPDGIRLEGYTMYNNAIWKVLAHYRLGSTDGILGEMELISITPE